MSILYYLLVLLLWGIVIWSTTQILVEVKFPPTEKLRRWLAMRQYLTLYKLLDCFICTSVWIAAFWSIALWSPTSALLEAPIYITILADAMIGRSIAWFIHLFEGVLESKIDQ